MYAEFVNGVGRIVDENDKQQFDMLEASFTSQLLFQGHQGYDFNEMTEKERADYVKTMSLMLSDETHEMLHEIPFFKPWKRYSDKPDDNYVKWAAARKEFVDMFHFFLNIALALGFTAEELYEMYGLKMQENYARQENTSEYKRDME